MVEALSAVTADGARLTLRRHPPHGSGRAACVLGHAMMARGAYFERAGFADHLAAAGLDTFVLDFRGHGDSVPPDPRVPPGWDFDAYPRLDLPAAMAAAAAAAGVAVADLAYLGHSLGGLAMLAAAGTGAVAAPRRLALFSTSVWLPGRHGSRLRRALTTAYAWSSRPLGYAPIRRLGFGSDDEPRPYVEQLAGWAETGAWRATDGTDYLAGLRNVTSPAWPVVGDGDRLCRAEDVQVLASRLPAARALRRVGRRHGDALDPDHFQFFTRAELAPLWRECADFLIG